MVPDGDKLEVISPVSKVVRGGDGYHGDKFTVVYLLSTWWSEGVVDVTRPDGKLKVISPVFKVVGEGGGFDSW